MSVNVWSVAVFIFASMGAGRMGVGSSIHAGVMFEILLRVSFKKSVIGCNIGWGGRHRKG
uniref:Uncharacterized protein n=1 Tax=Romanomermis culicivorax TaxID=13658 RepID=A0A915L8N0_ROMCU